VIAGMYGLVKSVLGLWLQNIQLSCRLTLKSHARSPVQGGPSGSEGRLSWVQSMGERRSSHVEWDCVVVQGPATAASKDGRSSTGTLCASLPLGEKLEILD
jgi:hypothetical protein